MEARDAPQALEAPREIDVLHQRNLGIAAQRVERPATDEDRLIAGRDAAHPRAEVHRGLDDAIHGAGGVESHIESSTHRSRIRQLRCDVRPRSGGQPRVRVEEQEHLSGGGCRTRIHLHRPPRWGRHHPAGVTRRDGDRAITAAAVDHDDLVRLEGGHRGQGVADLSFLIQHRDDDRDRHRGTTAWPARAEARGVLRRGPPSRTRRCRSGVGGNASCR